MIFRAKVCGITDAAGVRAAVAAGADAVGFNFHPESPRFVTPDRAAELAAGLPPGVVPVGIFVNRPLDEAGEWMERSGVRWAQFHGDEAPEELNGFPRPWYPAVRPAAGDEVNPARWAAPCLLVDARAPGAYGGTGRPACREAAARLARRTSIILAGGLAPENLQEALAEVRPAAIDLNSGVESAPGIKDAGRVARALDIFREWMERAGGEDGH